MLRNVVQRAKASLVYRLLLGRWLNQSRFKDPSRLVNSFYRAALGRLAEPDGLATRILQIQSGMPVEVLAEDFVSSAEFQARHGTGQTVDLNYVTALYRDGLGREPDAEGLAGWLAAGAKGATRANILATIACSAEAPKSNNPASPPETMIFKSDAKASCTLPPEFDPVLYRHSYSDLA